ncbi:MAG: FAD-binding protein [Pseudonocardiaceae bacterium]|nr:FAD-binding protein [Pseudonocardiaceae bacterium]
MVPALVAYPRSTAAVSTVLRAAHGRGLRVVPRGAGTRLSWGDAPSAVDLVVDVSRLDSVVSHAAGDLVVTVAAGVALATLQEALAPHGQRLALDPVVTGGTIGGAIATASAGPLRYRYGSVRDLLIGITVVRADGIVTHAGGTVVKNVAGYDLGKLYTGSLGTLGVITEAVFRLHPLPEAARWVTVATPDSQRAAAAVAAVRSSQNDAVALEVDRPVPGEPVTIGVALEGIAAGIGARCDEVCRLLGDTAGARASVADSPPDWWGLLPHDTATGPGATLTHEPAALGDVLAQAPGAVRGSAGAGVLAVGLHATRVGEDLDALRVLAGRHGGSAVLRCASPDVKQRCDVWGPVPALPLMQRVKNEFDPEHRLAPGRFVGGI